MVKIFFIKSLFKLTTAIRAISTYVFTALVVISVIAAAHYFFPPSPQKTTLYVLSKTTNKPSIEVEKLHSKIKHITESGENYEIRFSISKVK